MSILKAIVVYDEIGAYEYVDEEDARAMMLNRANGLGLWFLLQSFPINDDYLKEVLQQNPSRMSILRCTSPATADESADACREMLDQYEIKEYRERQLVDGHEEIIKISGWFWARKEERIGVVATHRTVMDPVYVTIKDQLTKLSQDIQEAPIGFRIHKQGNTIVREQVPVPLPITHETTRCIRKFSNTRLHRSGSNWSLASLPAPRGTKQQSTGQEPTQKPLKDLSKLEPIDQKKPQDDASRGHIRRKKLD